MSAPTRPPPIPRRHPSRPSLSASSSSYTGQSPEADVPPLPTLTPSQGSPALPAVTHTDHHHDSYSSHHPHHPSSSPNGANPIHHSHHNSSSSANAWMGAPHSSPPSDLGDSTSSPTATMHRHSQAGLGTANIGLGPVLLDFKDWVKAGQSSRDAASTVVAGGDRRSSHQEHQHDQHNHVDLQDSPQPRNSYGSAFSGSNRSAEAEYGGASVRESYSSYGGGSSEYTSSSPHAPYRSSPIPRTIPTHSLPSSTSRASISSLSIDSSHSPKLFGRAASRLSDRPPQDTSATSTSTTTPRRASHDFQREMSRLSLQASGRASRASYNHGVQESPLDSPAGLPDVDSPLGPERARLQHSGATMSPLERRFSRRLMSRQDSHGSTPSYDGHMRQDSTEVLNSKTEGSLDDRIREAEEKLARRASLRDSHSPAKSTASTPAFRRFHSTSAGLSPGVMSPPLSNGHTPPHDPTGASQNGTANRGGRLRQPIPAEFQQNGRMYSPSPGENRFSGLVDISSPRSPLTYNDSDREEIVSPRKSMSSYRPQTSMDMRGGPNPFNPTPNRLSRTFSRDRDRDLDHQAPFTPGGRSGRELPLRARPESVLETSADHNRYVAQGFGSSRRLSQYGSGGEQRSQRLSALLSSDRDFSTRNSRDLASEFGQRRDSLYSRDSVYSQRDSVYSQATHRDSMLSKRDSLTQRNSHLSHRNSYSSRGSRDFTRDSLRLMGGDSGTGRAVSRAKNRDSREIMSPSLNRESREFPRESRDFSSSKGGPLVAPSDSISAVGSRGGYSSPRVESRAESRAGGDTPRKDPLEIIRKLEETRSRANRQWEEDRSASAMGKYGEREMLARVPSRLDDNASTTRPGSRMSASRLGPRPASSMSSVRDYATPGSAPRTAPAARRRMDSGNSSNLDSPLVGRTSRASGSFTGPLTEPRVIRRSLTSVGGMSAASGASSGQDSSSHGRNLVEAARVLEHRAVIPAEVLGKLSAAAALAERANTGVRAANQMATELALEIELDEPDHVASVRSRFPRLAVTLKEASRASDQAVRDLTQALLAARGPTASSTSTPTPARPARMETSRHPPVDATHRRAATLDSPAPVLSHAHPVTSLSQTSKPYDGRESESDSEGQWVTAPDPTRGSDPPLSTTSSQFEGHHLDPIEQSPPRPVREESPRINAAQSPRESFSATTSPKTPGRGWDHSSPEGYPAPPLLRKMASTISTHTVRGNNTFLPSHPPEPTTALSNSPAYSTAVLEHPDEEVTQDKLDKLVQESKPESRRASRASLKLKELPNRESIVSVTSVYSNPEMSPYGGAANGNGNGSDITRTGTFGASQGAHIRASVSERFRKHLNGE